MATIPFSCPCNNQHKVITEQNIDTEITWTTQQDIENDDTIYFVDNAAIDEIKQKIQNIEDNGGD